MVNRININTINLNGDTSGGSGSTGLVLGYYNVDTESSTPVIQFSKTRTIDESGRYVYSDHITGEEDKLYIDRADNSVYKYLNSKYVNTSKAMEIPPDMWNFVPAKTIGAYCRYLFENHSDIAVPGAMFVRQQPGIAGMPSNGGELIITIINTAYYRLDWFSDNTSPHHWTAIYEGGYQLAAGGWIPDIIQFEEFPEASSTYKDKIYQYSGFTSSLYTNGYFYKCVENIAEVLFFAATPVESSQIMVDPVGDPYLFKTHIQASGTYTFTYTADGWEYNSAVVNPQEYGIYISGTPVVGDVVTATFTVGSYSWSRIDVQPSNINFIVNTIPSTGMVAGTRYVMDYTSESAVTLTLAAGASGVLNEYCIVFTTGSTAPTITWPTGVSWYGGAEPAILANKTYEIIIKDYGTKKLASSNEY